ncbi:hypothetical protein O3M35_005515 [Rhynocoris fuscipes]|uniref:Uncharacterized protein n=1 Tax=Rhynocoris fuscipes TaxID=488301 RepID=A0AAW1DIX3_9HEMI
MSPVFWLKITDWKKQSAQKIPINTDDPYKLFSNFIKSFCWTMDNMVGTRSIVSRIMNTPFEINKDIERKWIIKAEIIEENCIYLYYDRDDKPNNITDKMAKQYELLKRYLFVNHPVNRKVISTFNEMFGQEFYFNRKKGNFFYSTEIPGVISDQEITNNEQLTSVEYIYFDIFEDGEFSEDVINYNPIWWSKAALTKAKQCILASYDKVNDCLKEIYKFNIDKFDDKTKYENLWSPDAAWNFLNDFLNFVEYSVFSVSSDIRKKCVWKFQSYPNDEPFVSCEILIRNVVNDQETLTPITVNETNFP